MNYDLLNNNCHCFVDEILSALKVERLDKEYRSCGGLIDKFKKLPTSTLTGLLKTF